MNLEELIVLLKEQLRNNNARRKEFFDIETVIEDIYPDDPAFDREKAKVIGYTDSILYKFKPGKFIKHISRQWNCLMDEKIYSGKAIEKAPLLNSNYDSSFIAGILQLRYVYAMPVERIIHYFTENGFELCKSTAHGLIKKVAILMERFAVILKKVILVDDYICMDDKILTGEKKEQGKGVRKGHTKLVQFFYHKEHQVKPDWTPEQILAYRQEYAPPILLKLKNRLTEIQNHPQTLPKSPLAKAVNYMLGQFDALSNYILRHDYDLDNNAIERLNRYISISRRNSLFCGSHEGAKRYGAHLLDRLFMQNQ